MQILMMSVLLSIPLFFTTTITFANQTGKDNSVINLAYVAAGKQCYYSNGHRVCEGAAVVAPGARVYRGPVIRR
jgi:hypothetical protein